MKQKHLLDSKLVIQRNMKNKDEFRWLQKGVSDSIGCDPERIFSLIEFLKNCCSVNAGYNNYCVGDKDYIRIPVWGGFTKGVTIQINGIMPGMAPIKQKFKPKRDRTWSESRDRSVSFLGPFILSESETFLWCLLSVSVDFLKAKLLAMSHLQSQSLCLNNAFQLIELWLSWLFEEKIDDDTKNRQRMIAKAHSRIAKWAKKGVWDVCRIRSGFGLFYN